MAIAIPAAITGATMTGFTSPIYNTTVDTSPDINAKQVAVTSLGGTQTGVVAHSVSVPFTASVWRPRVLQGIGKPDPVTGLINKVPNNTYKQIVRKGVVPAVNQPAKPMVVRVEIDVPAGADTYDAANVKAAISCAIGLLWAQSAGYGDTAQSGIL